MTPTEPRSHFIFLSTPEQFEALLASHAPFVIFKHSPTCGTSAQAYDEMDELLQTEQPVPVHLLDVLASRPLSQAIAARLGVRHESPQVLVVKDGTVLWHGSHWRVTAGALRAVFEGLVAA